MTWFRCPELGVGSVLSVAATLPWVGCSSSMFCRRSTTRANVWLDFTEDARNVLPVYCVVDWTGYLLYVLLLITVSVSIIGIMGPMRVIGCPVAIDSGLGHLLSHVVSSSTYGTIETALAPPNCLEL